MIPQRVYKCNVIANDQKKIRKLLSHPLFSNSIINPISNVGVIQSESLILQVLVVSNLLYREKSKTKEQSEGSNAVFELDDQTINRLYSYIQSLEHQLAA